MHSYKRIGWCEMTTILSATIRENVNAAEKYNPYSQKTIEYVFRSGFINSESMECTAEITDHFVEDNSAVQDHMAIKPIKYTVRGLIAEKVFTPLEPYEYTVPYREIDKLGTGINLLGTLNPTLSSYMQTAVAAYQYVEASVKRYSSTISNIMDFFTKNKTGRTINATSTRDVIKDSKQERALSEILALRDARTLINLDTPYGDFTGFLIENAKIEQGANIWQSELVVTLKEYREVSTQTAKIDAQKYKDRYGQQMAQEENLGKVQGKDGKLQSTLYKMYAGFKQ